MSDHHATAAAAAQAKVLCNSDRYLPKAEQAARQLINSWITYGAKQKNECDPSKMPGILADVADGVLDAILRSGCRDFAGIFAYFLEAPEAVRVELVECSQEFAPMPQDCGPLVSIVHGYAHERMRDQLAHRLRDVLERGGDPCVVIEEITKHEASGSQVEKNDVFREMLVERAFDVNHPPPPPVPILMLGEKMISTPGNILAIQAGIKAGKTGVVGGINAALMVGRMSGSRDTLGFSSDNAEGRGVLHFDTEQSRCDHDATCRRALSRAGMEAPPAWFQSFSLADLSQANREVAIETAIHDAVVSFGGVFAVVLDGVADICRDPNDAKEAFSLVDRIHAAAIKYNCAFIVVIHENPGSEKTRGHLGSQLARKAETNLRLAKDAQTGVTTMWADYARHCHISKNDGICFSWSDVLGMHVNRGTAGQIKAGERQEKFRDEAEKAFGDSDQLTYTDLVSAIMQATGLKSVKTAEKRINTYQAEGVIIKTQGGSYLLKS